MYLSLGVGSHSLLLTLNRSRSDDAPGTAPPDVAPEDASGAPQPEASPKMEVLGPWEAGKGPAGPRDLQRLGMLRSSYNN